jgi:hypothetical protein
MINKNTFGAEMKIIKIVSWDKVIIQFQDEHKFEKEIFWANFKRGTVLNPYDKTAFGVGYIGDGEYKINSERKNYPRREYAIWKAMLERCYNEKTKDKYPAYYGICTVCKEWHNYQNFAKWYHENYYSIQGEIVQIDKDILVKGNKTYSPETCTFVPQKINMIFMSKSKNRDMDLPNAIYRCSAGFQASYGGKSLGVFKTIDDAINAHDVAMRIHIKRVAGEYKRIISDDIYERLMNW